MKFVDTHCHIHSQEFFTPAEAELSLSRAIKRGVEKVILVGTSLQDSKDALSFAKKHPDNCWVSIGIHPHEASKLSVDAVADHIEQLAMLATDDKVVAIGECGFDFYYNDKSEHLSRQEVLLRGQIEIALSNGLPLSFHVREAYDEFWRVFESYKGVRGVLHSFTDRPDQLRRAIQHALLIGINGIATFTTHAWQTELFKQIEIENFVLETDAPFLTPKPKRGSINSPENVIYITDYLADLRGETIEKLANATTANATKLFNLT